jgi:hypothetical protein
MKRRPGGMNENVEENENSRENIIKMGLICQKKQ